VLIVLGGCQFHPGHSAAVADGAPDGDHDGQPAPFCDPTADLVACYEFEQTTRDASPNALDATMTNVTFVAGHVGDAVHITAASAMDVAENAAVDIPALTIEAWIRPSVIPTGRAGVLDNDGQYSIFLYAGGDLRCSGFQLAANIQPNVWTHVGCTYDGTVRIFVNGYEVGASAGGGGSLSTTGTTGYSIGADGPPGSGSPLLGEIDQLRIFRTAHTAHDICVDSDASTCP
jgi:hypothetical protein